MNPFQAVLHSGLFRFPFQLGKIGKLILQLYLAVHSALLRQVADPVFGKIQFLPVQEKLFGILAENLHQAAEGRRFSGAIASEKAHRPTAFDTEADAVQDFGVPERLADVADLQFHIVFLPSL